MKCSDFIAEYLRDQAVDVVFDFTGGMITHLEDSISKIEGIRCFPTRHEQASGFAAEGYSRVSQKFGVAISTSGPGATNMMTAIGSCFFDSTPVLFITGQVNSKDLRPSKNIRQNGFQELDVVEMAKGITKYANLVLNPDKILYELEKAVFFMKNGRPGPALLDIPFDVLKAEIDVPKLKGYVKEPHKTKKENQHLKQLENLLINSKSPIILAGNGIKISKTKEQLSEFATRNNLPIVSSLMGLGEVSRETNNYLGFIGTYGNRHANIILANADLIIVLGSRLDLRQTGNPETFATNATVYHVDVDEYSSKLLFKDYIFSHAELADFFEDAKSLRTPAKESWLEFVEEIRSQFADKFSKSRKYCDPNLFFDYISRQAQDDAIIVGDVGQNQMWLAQSWQVKKRQSLLFSGGMGAMGFSLPTAIGASLANESRRVYSFMGDGGFQMNLQELETIKHNNLPIKIFVLNNNSLGMVREFQDQYFASYYQSTVIGYSCPSIRKIAEGFDIDYVKIENNNDTDKIDAIVARDKAVIAEVVLDDRSSLNPKVAYGESLENQEPKINEDKRLLLMALKDKFLN